MTVFFDLDGCLVDSRAAVAACINHALTSLGFDPRPAPTLYRYIGPPLREAFVELLGGERHADYAVNVYRQMYGEVSLTETTTMPGVEEALGALAAFASLVVVTTKPQPFAAPILEAVGLARYFDGVFGPSFEALTETKTQTLGRALMTVGEPAATSWMVGDRSHDVVAGKAHGLATVGVTWGIGDEEELTRAGADSIVSQPQQLPGVVLGADRRT